MSVNVSHESAALQRVTTKQLRARYADVLPTASIPCLVHRRW